MCRVISMVLWWTTLRDMQTEKQGNRFWLSSTNPTNPGPPLLQLFRRRSQFSNSIHVLPCCSLWWHRHFDANDTSGSAYPVEIGGSKWILCVSIPQAACICDPFVKHPTFGGTALELYEGFKKNLDHLEDPYRQPSTTRCSYWTMNHASFFVKPRLSQGLSQGRPLERHDTAEGLAHALVQGACRGWSWHSGLSPFTPGPSSPTRSTPGLFTTCGAPGVGTRITCGGSWTGSLTCCHHGSGCRHPPRTSWCHTRAAASRRVSKKTMHNHAQRFSFAVRGAVCFKSLLLWRLRQARWSL